MLTVKQIEQNIFEHCKKYEPEEIYMDNLGVDLDLLIKLRGKLEREGIKTKIIELRRIPFTDGMYWHGKSMIEIEQEESMEEENE